MTELVVGDTVVALRDGLDPALRAGVDSQGRLRVYVEGLEVEADTIDLDTSDLEAILSDIRTAVGDTRTLTERMFAKAPQSGYRLWLDTADPDHIYTLEAPQGSASGDTGFQGVRVTKDADGNPLGEVEVNTAGTLTFDNRTSDGGWA